MEKPVGYDRGKIESIIHEYTKKLLKSAFSASPPVYQQPPSVLLVVDEIEEALFNEPIREMD
jgi:hypothetical protein